MGDTEPIRLLLFAKYPVVCAGLRDLLRPSPAVEIIREVHSVPEAISVVSDVHLDIVVIDPDAPDIGIAGVAAVAQACKSRILVFTANVDPGLCLRAMELGASGVASKSCSGELLVRAISKVHAGELWLDRSQTAKVLLRAMDRGRDPESVKIDSLTKREREIVAKVGEGLKNSVVAQQLFISEATVRNHLTSILGKLELADRFELAVYAFRHGLVREPEPLAVRPANGAAASRRGGRRLGDSHRAAVPADAVPSSLPD